MKVYSGALVATLALSLWGAAAGDCMANRGQRVRGLVEEVELPRKNRRLMVTNVGGSGGGWMWSPGSGSGDLDTKAPSPAPVRPPNGSGGGGGGGGGSNGPTGGGGGSSGPIIIPEASGTRGRMKDRRMMRGRMRGKGGRSIRGSMGGFRGGGSRGGRTEGACTCMSCTTDVLNTKAGDFTCGTRIDFLLKNRSQDYPTTASACYHVAGIEFPDECGACNPFTCDGRTEPDADEASCGCETCTAEARNIDADGHTCGARISWAQMVDQASEEEACRLIAGFYPQCAPCNPDTCAIPVTAAPSIAGRAEPTAAPVTAAPVTAAPVTVAPVAAPVAAPFSPPVTASPTASRSEPVVPDSTPPPSECPEFCNCFSCSSAWMNDASGLTCGQRINWLIGTNIGEEEACRVVAGREFPNECGACNPDTCDGRAGPTYAPVAPPVTAPVAAPEPVPATASPTTSRSEPSPVEQPVTAPVAAPEPVPATAAPTTGRTEPSPVAAPIAPPVEAPVVAPVAAPEPVPATASPTNARLEPTAPVAPPVATPAPVTPAPTKGDEIEATPAPSTLAPVTASPTAGRLEPTAATVAPTSGRQEPTASGDNVYCFPPSNERKRYTNVWGNYMVEAKNSDEAVCDPLRNAFEDVLVSVDDNDDMTLTFRHVNGIWYSSEVRILPQSGAYTYGTYSFSVKEIRVVELGSNGNVVSNVLPAGLVLGMFTRDVAYQGGEIDEYEVACEISRFGVETADDAQFLIQPPESPHFYRFSTETNGALNQAPHTYEFTWLPTSVSWSSSAGGGQSFSYTTAQALEAGLPDRVQCLPANIDARVSLWSIRSALNAPEGLAENQQVQVVIDNFAFSPVDITGVAAGEACSKNCQCLSGNCSSGVCQ